MKYSIGEFSKLIGVAPGTLRLYEKHNIVLPEKNKVNKYRYYSDLDARRILTSRWFRSLGVSLEETAAMVDNADIDLSKRTIEQLSSDLEKEIHEKTLLLDRLNEIKAEISTVDNQCKHYSMIKVPSHYRIDQTSENTLIKNSNFNSITNQWMNYLPFTFFSFKIRLQDWVKHGELAHTWGLAVSEKYVKAFDIFVQHPSVSFIPSQTYLSKVIVIDQKELLASKHISSIKEELTKKQYIINGDISGQFLINDCQKDKDVSYLKVFVPVKHSISDRKIT